MLRRPVKRLRSGRYEIRLSPAERSLLRELPGQLKALLAATDEPSLRRLFPPAYVDDAEKESEYRRLMGDDLVHSHQEALGVLAATADAEELSLEQLTAWLRALNDLRLVLGTQLDVQEDEAPGDSTVHQVYYYLSVLEEMVVAALASQYD